MLVQLLKATHYKGPRKAGDIFEVSNDYASRWLRNRIAINCVEVEDTAGNIPTTYTEKEDGIEDGENEEDTSGLEVAYEDMSAKDLYKECIKKGLEVEARQPREYYLEFLTVKED